jgi:hypothetical protein
MLERSRNSHWSIFILLSIGNNYCILLINIYKERVNVLNLHIIDIDRKYHTHLQRKIEKEEAREKDWKNSN